MKFILDGENLTLALSAKESVWALRRNICIPVTSITNIEWVASTVNTGRLHGLRAPGTGLPGVFYAGSFYRKCGWEFWYLRVRQPGHVIITTTLKRYRVLRVSVAEDEALRIREWFNEYQNTGKVA